MNLIAPAQQQVVLELVRAAARFEVEARGSGRRTAFRTTRHLLAGAIAVGVSTPALAAELGVRADTVRTRAGHDGPIAAADFAALTGSPIDRIQSWNLPSWNEGHQMHSATLLLTALLIDANPASAEFE